MNKLATLKKVSLYLLCALTGLVFIFSAYTKLFPVEYFEYTFVDLGFANWTTAPFLARLLIGLECFTGILLITQIRLKKLALPLATALLVIFSIHLLAQIWLNGNKGNCGCFGNNLFMTPGQALLKNIVLLAIVFIVWKFTAWDGLSLHGYFIIGIALIWGIVLPFALNPLDMLVSESHNNQKLNYKLDIHWLYENPNDKSPAVDLTKGKHILAFLTLSCPHCRLAAYKLHVMHKRNPSLPIYFVVNGDRDEFKDFYNETKSEDVPEVLFKGMNFLKMSGPTFPSIYLLSNDTVIDKPNYMTLNQQKIENWLANGSIEH